MTGQYDREVATYLKSIAASMKIVAAHFEALGEAATFANDQVQQVRFISEEGE